MRDERTTLCKLYRDARVADVRDALDTFGLHGVGSVAPAVRPLWRTRACGIARTARYLPFDDVIPHLPLDGYQRWHNDYYRRVCPYPWVEEIKPGDFIVLDLSGVCAGLMGSENTLNCLRHGARGFVADGGVRDTDEIILQRVPFWSTMIAQCVVQGRLRYDAHNVAVAVGGVTVHPGDMVVADGDGVIVVPRRLAAEVGARAREVHRDDKVMRRKHYQALGRSLDATVKGR